MSDGDSDSRADGTESDITLGTEAGVVIVDNANRIIYCNTSAKEILECDAADAIGLDVELLVDESRLTFARDDALAEIDRDGRTYEGRSSPITDRGDRDIGNTFVIHDVTARESPAAAATGAVSVIRDDEGEGLVEWQMTGDALLGMLVDHGGNVREARADGGRVTYDVETASETDLRTLLDRISERYDDTRVLSKRERARVEEATDSALSEGHLDDLTDRQQEVLEAAYRAGYFNWPRDANAEEVAESLDISSATLHSHLRKAEDSLLTDLFRDGSDTGR